MLRLVARCSWWFTTCPRLGIPLVAPRPTSYWITVSRKLPSFYPTTSIAQRPLKCHFDLRLLQPERPIPFCVSPGRWGGRRRQRQRSKKWRKITSKLLLLQGKQPRPNQDQRVTSRKTKRRRPAKESRTQGQTTLCFARQKQRKQRNCWEKRSLQQELLQWVTSQPRRAKRGSQHRVKQRKRPASRQNLRQSLLNNRMGRTRALQQGKERRKKRMLPKRRRKEGSKGG